MYPTNVVNNRINEILDELVNSNAKDIDIKTTENIMPITLSVVTIRKFAIYGSSNTLSPITIDIILCLNT